MLLTRTPPSAVPVDVLEAILRAHVGDPTAVITACTGRPLPTQGTNDSTTVAAVTFTWMLPESACPSHTATWIVKHWRADGVRDRAAGISQPREVLAWEHGLLRAETLPDRVLVPVIGAQRSPDQTEAWLAMADVSADLAAYPRASLTSEQALRRTQQILARLAPFHAWWEHPDRQAQLRACPWLRRPETCLWDLAPTDALALGRPPVPDGLAGTALPVWDGLSADLHAFLAWRPAADRALWESLLLDRRALVEALAPYPPTLLHGDLDDRNIGLRWAGGGAGPGASGAEGTTLVLIDWEWMGIGPAALDVAKLVLSVPVVIAPGAPIPQAVWTHALADDYYAHYCAAGGRCTDAAAWRRAYGLALVAHGVAQMPATFGNLVRTIQGELPPPPIVGVPDAVVRQHLTAILPLMDRMVELVTQEARQWLSGPPPQSRPGRSN